MSLSGKVGLTVNFSVSRAAGTGVISDYTIPVQPAWSGTITDGTGAGTYSGTSYAMTFKGNKLYMTSGTAAASTPVDIDLTTTANADGSTGFSYVRALIIWNDATTTGYTLTTGAGTNPFKSYLTGTSPTRVIEPGTFEPIVQVLSTNGYAITNSSNDIVRLDPGSNDVPYRVLIIGS